MPHQLAAKMWAEKLRMAFSLIFPPAVAPHLSVVNCKEVEKRLRNRRNKRKIFMVFRLFRLFRNLFSIMIRALDNYRIRDIAA